MKFRYGHEKNATLLADRGVGFEEMIEEIANGNIVTITSHHNQERYPNQKILHVKCLGQIYLVPYVMEENGTISLKTLYPSRKATKSHLSNKNK